MPGSIVVLYTFLPKFRFEYTPHSPLASGLSRSQFGTKSRFTSVHERDTDVARRIVGFNSSPKKPPSVVAMYLPSVIFSAVLPSPPRSYDAAIRGVTSCSL